MTQEEFNGWSLVAVVAVFLVGLIATVVVTIVAARRRSRFEAAVRFSAGLVATAVIVYGLAIFFSNLGYRVLHDDPVMPGIHAVLVAQLLAVTSLGVAALSAVICYIIKYNERSSQTS